MGQQCIDNTSRLLHMFSALGPSQRLHANSAQVPQTNPNTCGTVTTSALGTTGSSTGTPIHVAMHLSLCQ